MIEQARLQSKPTAASASRKRLSSLRFLRYLAFPTMLGALGLYVLLHSPLRPAMCVFCFESLSLQRGLGAFSALWLLAAACGAAWLIARRLENVYPLYEQPLVFGLSAFALMVVPAALLGEAAERLGKSFLHPPAGPFLASLPAVLVIAYALTRARPLPGTRLDFPRPGRLALFTAGVSGLVLFAAVAIGLMHPATSGDALSYHANLAVYLWRDGNLGTFLDHAPATWALAHPGMVELWFGLLWVMGGEHLANLGQFPFVLLGCAALYAFACRSGLKPAYALLAAVSFPLIPMVALQSVMQPNDVAGAALLMSLVALTCAPVSTWSRSRLVFIGLGLGLVASTKLALLPYVLATGLFCGIALVRQAWLEKEWRALARGALILALAFLLVVSPWWGRNLIRYGNPIFPSAIPGIGRGIFLQDLGVIDTAFVPSRLAWPLYPLLEAYDDRSGFGALFLIGAIPGLVIALFHARRQPMFLFFMNGLLMLPAWWFYSLHEPRFFLGLVGLSYAFIPWTLQAVPRRQYPFAAVLLAAAAGFSALLIFDQGLLPLARQPNDRSAFYDRVWAVDPAATTLAENEGLLLHTGFAPAIFEYTAFYPLLGKDQSRQVIPVDGEKAPEILAALMRKEGIRYAYVAVSPGALDAIESQYPPSLFVLVHKTGVMTGEKISARRNLYRPAEPGEEAQATWRYLFRLK